MWELICAMLCVTWEAFTDVGGWALIHASNVFLFTVAVTPFNYADGQVFNMPPVETMTVGAILGSLGLGFCLSLLFFMDQNISSAMVNNPANK